MVFILFLSQLRHIHKSIDMFYSMSIECNINLFCFLFNKKKIIIKINLKKKPRIGLSGLMLFIGHNSYCSKNYDFRSHALEKKSQFFHFVTTTKYVIQNGLNYFSYLIPSSSNKLQSAMYSIK